MLVYSLFYLLRLLRKAISSQLALLSFELLSLKTSIFEGKEVRVMKRWSCAMVSIGIWMCEVELYRMAKNAI